MIENEIGSSHGDTVAQSLPVKISASPRHREKIKMKDSGIPWIGEIPEDWEVFPFKTVFRESKSVSEFGEEMLLSVSQYTGITPKKDSVSDGEHLSRAESLAGYRIVHVDDFVMNIMLAWNGSLGISQYSGIVSPAYAVFRLIRKSHPQFLHYLLRTEAYTTYFRAFSSGIIESRLRLYPEIFLRLLCVLPPLETQKRIAEFLDKKTAEIDALIALQEKMITELKSYKQSVITEAVTRGVPANIKTSRGDTEPRNVPLKDSGIPWLGSIPTHWDVKRLKFESVFLNGYAFDSNSFVGEGGPVIRIGDIQQTICYEACVKAQPRDDLNSFKIEDSDVLIAMSGATTGKTTWVEQAQPAYINQRVGIIRSVISKYLYYALQTPYFMEYINLFNAGSAQPNISSKAIGNFALAVPVKNKERGIQEIVEYLDQKCAEIDSIISLKQQKITTLQNYKKSVIFECVTGKSL